MSILNRKIQPDFEPIPGIEYIEPKVLKLDNGIELFSVNAGNLDILRLELIFKGGSYAQKEPLIASSTAVMLAEGTKKMSAQKIAESIDFYGAFPTLGANRHSSNVGVYTLSKYLPQTIEILQDMVFQPTFPQDEFATMMNKRIQGFHVQHERTGFIARREFFKLLFSIAHPYGKITELKDYKNLNTEQLFDFHKRYYNSDNCKILLAGKFDDTIIQKVNQTFGQENWRGKSFSEDKKFEIPENNGTERVFIKKENAMQSTICIGKKMINKKHSDYIGVKIVDTILGGFFGSRLMQNLREDKGYTYHIDSMIASARDSGYFLIETDVANEVCKDALDEIYKEIRRIRQELVSVEELEVVKNQILSEMLKLFDGPFGAMQTFWSMKEYDMTFEFFDNFIEVVNKITPTEIRDYAKKYLHEDSMTQVVSGNPDGFDTD